MPLTPADRPPAAAGRPPAAAGQPLAAAGRPPFRADHIGSLLRPPALRSAFRRHASGDLGEAEFTRLQDDSIRDVIALQEAVGLRVVTDGEFRRGSYWSRFVERTDGFAIRPAVFTFRDDHGHEVEFTAPYATGEDPAGAPAGAGRVHIPAPSH